MDARALAVRRSFRASDGPAPGVNVGERHWEVRR